MDGTCMGNELKTLGMVAKYLDCRNGRKKVAACWDLTHQIT